MRAEAKRGNVSDVSLARLDYESVIAEAERGNVSDISACD